MPVYHLIDEQGNLQPVPGGWNGPHEWEGHIALTLDDSKLRIVDGKLRLVEGGFRIVDGKLQLADGIIEKSSTGCGLCRHCPAVAVGGGLVWWPW